MARWATVMQLFSLATGVGPVVDKIAEKAVEGGVNGLQWVWANHKALLNVEADIDKLRRDREHISAILKDAEETRFIEDQTVREWLSDLKDFAFDVEDLVDEFQIGLDIAKLEKARLSPGSRKRRRPWDIFPPCLTWVYRQRTISVKIKEIKEKFEEIKQRRNDFQLREGESRRRQQDSTQQTPQHTGSLRGDYQVLGLEEEKKEILMHLRQGGGVSGAPNSSQREGRSVPVVAIIGPGGIGKTTLARLVFSDEEIERSSFLKIWVGVSRDFDVCRITKEIIKSITEKSCCGLSLDLLQRKLRELVLGKKFLLVLDGLCNNDLSFWDTLQAPLMVGGEGSRVLVTARSEQVLTYMRPRPSSIIWLNGLGENDSWLLFCSYAFRQAPTDHDVGREIVRRCHGSPLAIISIGGLLYSRTEEWRSILSDIPDPEDEAHGILSTLKVSYDYLPLHLKQCFAFCSIFPNGYEFDKEELVEFWVAVGLAKPRDCRSAEYIGYRYFDSLLRWSFFQGCNGRHHQKQKYKMPGLIHELAQSVSAHECLRIENDASFSESENARYALSCNFPMELPIFQKLYQNKKLRTFILLGENGTPTKQVPRDLYTNLRCLRVLDLRRNELTELPDSIGNLIHLRYLNLLGTQIERLPESLCSLYNLQLLELGDCKKLVELPRGMSNLINLRYLGLRLDWENCRHRWSDVVMPPGLGRLTSLHTLSRFSVSSESGCGISELKGLKLRGEICISKLEIVDVRDAMEASLGTKQHLETMILRWTNCRSPASQSGGGRDVIEQLCPNSNLKHLWIENYKGAEFPSWLGDQSMNLETLRLYGCERSERLPPVGRLRNLKCLFLEGLHTVTDLGSLSGDGNFAGFPSLEMITISNLKTLERGFELVQDEMPCLRKLVISDCSNLLQLPQLPNSLEDIEIRECPALSALPMLSSLQQLVLAKCGLAIIESIHQFTSLSSLTISQFPRLGSITREHLQDLGSLRKLKIDQCDNFVSLSSQHLVSLETLEISQCCTFSSLAGEGLPASLEDLRLQSCGNLTYFPGEGMPASLQRLAIGGCPTLEQRCQVGGRDWHKIQHVPRREIGENSTV
ncbi:putative disease resistance protein RGA3 [Musa acuminata AAA Group]|uniref:putative disease resistance protein RGA3 n=1 Tax=Musa acuminata AAA Group TaxID=214697 RepID=UPI0031CE3E90